MYHDVAGGPATGGADGYFAVSRAGLARQLDLIVESGARGCSLEEAVARPGTGRIAITFDDGTSGQLDQAVPELASRGMTATFFVATAWVGRPGCISWDGLREMKAAGLSIQSHTRSHPFLSELAPAEVLEELRASRLELDQRLGQQTVTLALPGGDMPRSQPQRLFREAGYRVVATSRWGVNRDAGPGREDPVLVRRCTIRGEPEPDQFRRVLAGDRWLGLRRRARETALGALRRSLGPSRYARLRRGLLAQMAGGGT
jgi:peptidoglycan/xylan/chitin deacetylase (PgdA/CDA1 family)